MRNMGAGFVVLSHHSLSLFVNWPFFSEVSLIYISTIVLNLGSGNYIQHNSETLPIKDEQK